MGYKFQFITLAGFHALNHSMFELARGYAASGMTAYVQLAGGRVRGRGRRLHRDQAPAEVGTGYFDAVSTALNPEQLDHRPVPAQTESGAVLESGHARAPWNGGRSSHRRRSRPVRRDPDPGGDRLRGRAGPRVRRPPA